jgi:hypothetical protein
VGDQRSPLGRLDVAVARAAKYVAGRSLRGVAHDEADEVVGTIECDDAIAFDPRTLLAALDLHGAHAVVMGQVAGILHGSEELTGDLDLLWSGDADEAPRFVAAFADVEARLADQDGRPLPLGEDAFAVPKVLFRSPHASGDCCTPRLPWGRLDIVGIIERALVTTEGGLTVRYLSLDDLIVMRRAAGRPKDLRRALELERLHASP